MSLNERLGNAFFYISNNMFYRETVGSSAACNQIKPGIYNFRYCYGNLRNEGSLPNGCKNVKRELKSMQFFFF